MNSSFIFSLSYSDLIFSQLFPLALPTVVAHGAHGGLEVCRGLLLDLVRQVVDLEAVQSENILNGLRFEYVPSGIKNYPRPEGERAIQWSKDFGTWLYSFALFTNGETKAVL